MEEKKFARVDIVDNDIGYYDERVMNTFFIVNPNLDKLEELQNKLNNRFEDGEIEQYGDVIAYMNENFEVLKISDHFEIEW